MATAAPADQLLAFLVPRTDVDALARQLLRAPRVLPVNSRTLVAPHARAPQRNFARELDAIVGPLSGEGPFARVSLHTVGIAEFASRTFLSWVRTEPVEARPALESEPWDGRNPLAEALAELPHRLEAGGLEGFWAATVELGLAAQAHVDEDERRRWAAAATRHLAVTAHPVVVTVAAPTDSRWSFWPPSFW
jgi:hypothetical protein